MKKHQPTGKESQLFDWHTEPKDERPSEFHSTGFTTASGYYHSLSERRDHPVRRRSGTGGPKSLLMAIALVLLLGGAGLYGLVHWLRG